MYRKNELIVTFLAGATSNLAVGNTTQEPQPDFYSRYFFFEKEVSAVKIRLVGLAVLELRTLSCFCSKIWLAEGNDVIFILEFQKRKK